MKWCEIFTSGRHKDSKGNIRDWTKSDLEEIKSNFYTKNPDAPICCGHPKSNSPAYGWVDDLKIEDDINKISHLYASYKDVQPEFKEAYNRGLFKTRSISLTPDLVLRHVAFLGAQTPAIKGLEQFCFADCTEEILIEFEESSKSLSFDDKENAGTLTNTGTSNEANSKENNGQSSIEDGLGAAQPQPHQINEENTNMKGQEMSEEELRKEIAAKDDTIAALQKQIDDAKKLADTKNFEDFCDKAIQDGNILPAQKNDVLNILFACNDSSINFDDGSEKPATEVFQNFVKSLKQIDFEEIATPQKNDKSQEINFEDAFEVQEAIKKVQKEYADKGINLSTVEAYNKLK